jgi:hypothetical protein
MHAKMIWISLLCATLFVPAVFVLGGFVDHIGGPPYVDYLLGPGVWVAYGLLAGNVHELSPIIVTITINILFYWIIFSLLLSLMLRRWRRQLVLTGQGSQD